MVPRSAGGKRNGGPDRQFVHQHEFPDDAAADEFEMTNPGNVQTCTACRPEPAAAGMAGRDPSSAVQRAPDHGG